VLKKFQIWQMCVAAMSLCMIVLIVTRKRGDGRYYFALWQTNNTPNKLLLSESAVSCMASSRKTPTLCERNTRQLWGTNLIHPLTREVKDTLLTRKRQLTADSDRFFFRIVHYVREVTRCFLSSASKLFLIVIYNQINLFDI
jgi:hypothetical protein